MSGVHVAFLIVMCGLVVWGGRRIPLVGLRKPLAIGCRVLALGGLCLALWGPPARRTLELPRRIVYLVDRSASLDGRQRAWMARRLASLESLRPPHVERAVVAFGAEARVVVPFGLEPLTDPEALQRILEGASVRDDQTNLGGALLSAIGLLPASPPATGQAGRTGMVVLSDGRETTGDVTGLLPAVRRFGVEMFPVPPPLFGDSKTAWEALAVPPVVQRGGSVPIQLVVFNAASRPKPGTVTVTLQGVALKRQRVTVRPGWQVLTVTAPAIQRGTMALDVTLEIPADRTTEHRLAYTEVEGPPQLLLVSDRLAALPALATALKRREIDIASARPSDLPATVGPLVDSEAILLFNVPKSSLTAPQVEALRAYVERFGGGLVMVGLGGDLAHEVSTPSPLDALLPIAFEPKGLQESKRRVCMILLIDRSASMIGPRIAATKRAAVELVRQLSPEDLVGILTFDTEPYVIAEVQPVGGLGSKLVEKLVKLHSSGGTDVFPALAASANRLELTGATLKHIILLSDGNTPFEREAYAALFTSFKLSGTTISTIGVGEAFINEDYLRFVAESTGGTFYQMRTLDELPQLIARDTRQALGRLPFTEGYFQPVKTPTSDWFVETAQWPSLRGYFTATARGGARVDLTVNGGAGDDPLLARWTLGQGRVVSFTSDADTRWSPAWIRWPGFDATWAQVVRWAMRPRLTEELFAWVDEGQEVPHLIVEGELGDPRGELVGGANGGTVPVSLIQVGPWRWQASLEHIPSGWYQLVLESHQAGGTIFAKRWLHIGAPPTSQEIVGQPPNEALLRQLARVTNGVYDAPDRAFLPPTTTGTTVTPLFTWWLPVVIVLLLVDIALRGSSML